MWNYCADIFQNHAQQLKNSVESLVNVLESGSGKTDGPVESFEAYSKNINELLERLTSGLYGRYISDAVMAGSRAYR
jgi:hypothetical protein